jgi:hypothetical protein
MTQMTQKPTALEWELRKKAPVQIDPIVRPHDPTLDPTKPRALTQRRAA